MRTGSISKLHDFLMSLAMFATVLLLVVPPYGLLAGFCSQSLQMLVLLWGEILYMALVLFIRAVRRERDDFRRIDSAIRHSGLGRTLG
ncbi:MAG: hypothetical protein ACI4NA_09170 [Succinivibrio sp.]